MRSLIKFTSSCCDAFFYTGNRGGEFNWNPNQRGRKLSLQGDVTLGERGLLPHKVGRVQSLGRGLYRRKNELQLGSAMRIKKNSFNLDRLKKCPRCKLEKRIDIPRAGTEKEGMKTEIVMRFSPKKECEI